MQIKESFNPLEEYADLFPEETPTKLPLIRKINYEIRFIPGAKQKPERIFSHDRFKDQITEKIDRETVTGRTYATTDTENAVLIFTQPKKGSKKARFLLNCIPRNLVTIKDKTPLFNIDQLIFPTIGYPVSITLDRDPLFTSYVFTEWARKKGIRLDISTAYHQQTDGQTEIVNKELKQVLKVIKEEGKNWLAAILEIVTRALQRA